MEPAHHAGPRLVSEDRQRHLWDVGGVWGSKVGLNGPPDERTERHGLLRRRRTVVTQLVYGFGARAPEIGDLIASPRQSGRTAIFQVTDVTRERDPSDMWTGRSRCLGYADEPKVSRLVAECVKGTPGFDGLIEVHP